MPIKGTHIVHNLYKLFHLNYLFFLRIVWRMDLRLPGWLYGLQSGDHPRRPGPHQQSQGSCSLYHFHILMPELHWWSPSPIKIYNLIPYLICKILDICEYLTHFETWWRNGWGLTESNCPILLVPFDLQEHKIHNMLCLLWIIYAFRFFFVKLKIFSWFLGVLRGF